MEMTLSFPGGKSVDAKIGGITIHTDQPVYAGGDGSGPAPFDLFLASIATCVGFYALRFCQQRDIPTDELRVIQRTERDPEARRLSRISIDIHLPPEFPAKYRRAILRAADQCAVKRHIIEPPEFEVRAMLTEEPQPA